MISKKYFRLKKNGEPNCGCYCRHPELIENYDKAIADTTQTWDCHHRMEKYFPQKTLVAIGWYYDCEPELIENYDLAIADKDNVWYCHHKLEAFYTMQELIDLSKYYNVSP